MSELPLFPLPDTVVFPGMTVPLYVFEQRYRKLVRGLVEHEPKRFVICLAGDAAPIRDAAPALPIHGSYVDVLSVEENRDGTFNLLVHGQQRCRLELLRHEMVAEPESEARPLYFVDDRPDPIRRDDPNEERVAAWDTIEVFRSYASTFFAFDAQRQIEEALPEDPLYQASFVCANVRIPAASRQVLLEAPSLVARFQLASKLMQERIDAHKPPKDL